MPIYASIKTTPPHVFRKYVGPITLQDLDDAFYRTSALQGFDPKLPQLNDLREATLALSARDLEYFFETISKRENYHGGKAAIVVNTQVAKILEESLKLISQISLGYKMFSDMSSAEAYLFDSPAR